MADPWGDRGACGNLCCPPLVVLPNDIGQTAEKEEGKTWITTNFSSQQDCYFLRHILNKDKTILEYVCNLLPNYLAWQVPGNVIHEMFLPKNLH